MKRRLFLQRSMSALISSVFVKHASAAPGFNPYALNPVYEYLKTWTAPEGGCWSRDSFSATYDIVDWKALSKGHPTYNKVVGELRVERNSSAETISDTLNYVCGNDRWQANVICKNDAGCTPSEWQFRSFPLVADESLQELAEIEYAGNIHAERGMLEFKKNRKTVSFDGLVFSPLNLFFSSGTWDEFVSDNSCLNALQEFSYLLPNQRFVFDGRVSFPGGHLDSFLHYGDGCMPTHYLRDHYGRPLVMTGFLQSFVLTGFKSRSNS